MIYLYGAKGHGKVIIEIAELLFTPIGGLIDDNPNIKSLFGYSVSTEIPKSVISHKDALIISIGNNQIRAHIAQKLPVRYITLIHPDTNVSKRMKIGAGTVVMAGVSVNSSAEIGNHVILNTSCSVDHDCQIGDFVHLSPQASLAGNVQIGEGSQIGIGATVIQGVKIGKWCTIGAGSVILKDIPDYATVVGNPGRLIRIKGEKI